MNRFFRTAYATTLVFILATIIVVSLTGVSISPLSFGCLYIGLFVFLLPDADDSLVKRRFICSVFGPLIALLGFLPIILTPGTGLLHYFAYGLGLIAAIVFLFVLRERTRYSDFEAVFRFSSIIVVFVVLCTVMASTSTIIPVSSENVMRAFTDSLLLVIVMLVTGFLLLRGLRAEQSVVDRKSFYRHQFHDALILTVIVAVISVINPFPNITVYLNFISTKIIDPATDALSRTLNSIIRWLSVKPPVPETATSAPDNSGTVNATPPPTAVPGGAEPTVAPNAKQIEEESNRFFKTLVIIFISIVALILLLIIIKELRKLIHKLRNPDDNNGIGYPNEVREELPDDDSDKPGDKLSKRSPDPRERMRWLYGDFLKHLRKVKHVRVRPSDTCGEIGEVAARKIRQRDAEIDEFTGLYENARYCSNEEPTLDDAERMKNLLGAIKQRGDDV